MPRADPTPGVSANAIAGEQGKFFELNKYGSLNTQAARSAIGEQDFSWIENMFPIGDGNMRALLDNDDILYTTPAGTTINYFYCYNIASNTYSAIFLDDGSAFQVHLVTGAVTQIAPIGTFFPGDPSLGSPTPAATQWQSSGIVIVTTASTNGLFAWDGATLFGPGSAAPAWLTNNTPTTMPSGVSGTCVEAYQDRLWIGNGVVLFNSAPGNGADFSGPSGGGAAPQNDSTLRREITQLRKNGSFLYLFGDSEVNSISNPQATGSGSFYNNQNVDDKYGTPWHNTVQGYNGALLFANSAGVFSIEGGRAQKISGQALDGIFASAATALGLDQPLATQQLSSAVATIYGIPVYMLVMPLQDPFTKAFRNGLVMFSGQRWFIGSQTSGLAFVGTQEVNSNLAAYGTSGTQFFRLFRKSAGLLNKIIQSKLWPGVSWVVIKDVLRAYAQFKDNSGAGYTLTGTVDLVNENSQSSVPITITSQQQPLRFTGLGGARISFIGAGLVPIVFTVAGLTLNGQNNASSGALVGITLQSTSPDFTMISLALLYREKSMIGG